jgi:hypothetical protein
VVDVHNGYSIEALETLGKYEAEIKFKDAELTSMHKKLIAVRTDNQYILSDLKDKVDHY